MQPLDPNHRYAERVLLQRDMPAIAATSTLAIAKVDRPYRIDRVEIIVDAAYAADPANYYQLALVHGAGPTTAASWSTETGQQGALTGGASADMVPSADANLVVAAGETISLVATKAAAAANIQPRIVVHGRYVA